VVRHTNSNRPVQPRVRFLRLGDIEGVHPAVLKGLNLKHMAPEPLVGLRGLRDEVIEDTFDVPRLAVVPIRGGKKYWVWGGIRSYLRLVNLGWPNEFSVLDYGREMPENRIVDLARADFRFAYIFSRQSAKSDRAIAREWEADTSLLRRKLELLSVSRGESNQWKVRQIPSTACRPSANCSRPSIFSRSARAAIW
jgi:hypothetical protein